MPQFNDQHVTEKALKLLEKLPQNLVLNRNHTYSIANARSIINFLYSLQPHLDDQLSSG